MVWTHIHPDFELEGHKFNACREFLRYVKENYPAHFAFLNDWCQPDNTLIAFTSGSTGEPKSIKLDKKAMLQSARRTINFFNLKPGKRVLINLSADYIAGKMMWVRALTGGWHVEVSAPDNKHIYQKLKNQSFDFGAMVPVQVQKNLDFIKHFKTLIIGGGVVSNRLQKSLEHLPVDIFATYGMTETVTHIAVKSLSKQALYKYNLPTEVYRVFEGIKIDVDDRGCLIIKAPDLNHEPIITNDVVRLIDKQHFQWLGRFDNIINTGGLKFVPEQLEEKIKPLLSQDFFIGSLPHPVLGKEIVLLVEGKVDKSKLNKLLVKNLGKYEMPKKIIDVAIFLRTSSGKIRRKAILQQIKSDPQKEGR